MALGGVGAQQFRPGTSVEHRGEFPAEVERVLHRHVHALAGFRAVRMTSVAGDEDARQSRRRLIRGHVVKAVGNALADLIDREPDHAFHVERVRAQHTLRRRDHRLLGVLVAKGVALVRVDLAEIDIQPHHVAALARDQQDVALVAGLDRGLEPDVREVGCGQHVHHAPGVVGEVAARHGADGIAHRTARTVAADDVLGAHGGGRAGGHVAQRHHHRVLASGLDLQRDELQPIGGLEPRRRQAHVVEQVLLQARLVDDDMRKLRQAVFGVLHAAGALDARAVLLRRTPEHGLVDPVGLPDELLPQTEGLEHLDRAAGDAVGLAHLQRALAALDQPRADAGEVRQLRGQQGPGGPAADDEHVDRVGQLLFADIGVAGCIAIQIELHGVSFVKCRCSVAPCPRRCSPRSASRIQGLHVGSSLRGSCQTLSTTSAMPCPTPMHMVHSA